MRSSSRLRQPTGPSKPRGTHREALAAYEWTDGNEIRVRMGLHTGTPRVVDRGYVGLDVHHAARVMAAGHGGQILLTAATRERLTQEPSLIDLGEHRLKDLLQPEHLFQLVVDGLPTEFPALKTLGNRPNNLPQQPNALIGRDRELEARSESSPRRRHAPADPGWCRWNGEDASGAPGCC